MVNFDNYKEKIDTLSKTSYANTNENTMSSPSESTAQHPQPWCGQHLTSGEGANTKNIYSYSNLDSKIKTPMWRIAELARFHKLKHEYKLLDESGPAHKKLFTVRLVLTDNQCFEGSGASIKKAQQAAASEALEKTSLKFPPEKSGKRKKEPSPPELLTFFAKRLELSEPVYRPHVHPKSPRTRLQGPFPTAVPSMTSYYPHAPVSDTTTVTTSNGIPVPPQGCCLPPTVPQTMPCIQPAMMPSNSMPLCMPMFPFDVSERLCIVSVTIGPGQIFTGIGQSYLQAKSNAATQALLYLGPAIQRLDSKFIEDTLKQVSVEDLSQTMEKMSANDAIENGASSQSSDDPPKHKQKSVVSILHECAHQMKLDVEIEVIMEDGPPHDRSYEVNCALRNVSDQIIVENCGRGRKKKIATQQACLGVLAKLQELENSPIYMASYLFKAQKKNKTSAKEGKRKTIVKDMKMDPAYGHQINPITRLIQILHARCEPDPIFTVVGEHGLSRYKEFIIEVRCGDTFCTGSGPNKRLAKRAAAEEMLSRLGYIKPLPPPGKSLLKKKEPVMSIGVFDPNELASPISESETCQDFVEESQHHGDNESRCLVSEDVASSPSEPSSGHVSPSLALAQSPTLKRRVTFSNQVRACPPPDDANYPKPEVAPLKADVVVEGRLKRMRKSKDGKRTLSDVEKSELTDLANSFLSEYCVAHSVNAYNQNTEGSAQEEIQVFREKLEYFADKFKFSVQYTNFPKSPDGCDQYYFALVTLGLDKPVVCHGSGLTVEGAAENGAYNAICRLAKIAEDENTSNTTGNS